MRDLVRLQAMAVNHGPAIGAYATALLDIPLPWTRMRQVYALLGLVKKWGAQRVEAACASALDHEVIKVSLIARMLERGSESTVLPPTSSATVIPARFARDPSHFGVQASNRPHLPPHPEASRPSMGLLEDGFDADVAGEGR